MNETPSPSSWQTCPRCQVHIIAGMAHFSHRPAAPHHPDELAKRVCQWAHAQDRRDGTLGELSTKPNGCINPCYDSQRAYGSPLDDIPNWTE